MSHDFQLLRHAKEEILYALARGKSIPVGELSGNFCVAREVGPTHLIERLVNEPDFSWLVARLSDADTYHDAATELHHLVANHVMALAGAFARDRVTYIERMPFQGGAA